MKKKSMLIIFSFIVLITVIYINNNNSISAEDTKPKYEDYSTNGAAISTYTE